jgi:Icc protein
MKRNFSRTLVAILFLFPGIFELPVQAQQSPAESFTFAFLTDIHLQPERQAREGFRQAIAHVNHQKPDFSLTGGDLIMDALGVSYERADSLYRIYQDEIRLFQHPVYHTMGNHEIYGIYKESQAKPLHPEFGEKMFENRLGSSYYSFIHKGWKFMVLNSVEATPDQGYIGWIDSVQMNWIRGELKSTPTTMPIVLSTHIPMLSVYNQIYYASTKANDSSLVVANGKDVLDLFGKHNLKLVLQGHLHTIEHINVNGTHFLTGGAVSGAWWTGPNKGFEEGYILIRAQDGDIDWEYMDYGWTPPQKKP